MADRHDTTSLLSGIQVPTLLVSGEEDTVIPSEQMEAMAKQQYKAPLRDFIGNRDLAPDAVDQVKDLVGGLSDYKAIHFLINHESFSLGESFASGK